MRRSLALATLIMLAAMLLSNPALARPAVHATPPAIAGLLDAAAKALAKPDREALKLVADGDPAKVFYWQFRAGNGPGFAFARRVWKAAAIQPPGTDQWLAVFWDYQPCESQGDHVHRLVRRGGQWRVGAEIPESETFGYHIRDHRLAVRFDLPKHGAKFTDTVTIDHEGADAAPMQIRLSADFPLENVTTGGKPVTYSQEGGVIYITPPAGREFTLDLAYSGLAFHPGMFVGNYVTEKEVVLSAYWYPVIGRLPSTHSVTATVPKGWTAIGQGDDLGHTDQGQTSTYSFHMAVPTCFFTFDAGPYYKYAKQVNGRTYQVYLTQPDEKRAQKQLDGMDASFRLFERLWGPYRWDKYTIVETGQRDWPGALEAYSFTTYGPGLIPGDNPHEWGHTWWGGFTPCTYLKDIWNESVTTYSESVFYRYGKGDDSSRAAMDRVYWRRPSPSLERESERLPLSETWDALYLPCSTVGYVKGGLVLQNLEETLGFDLFQNCLRNLREKFEGSGQAATWADVETAVNATTGQDYDWWFAQWVRRGGLPKLALANVASRESGGSYEVEADIVQSGATYRVRVPVWLEMANGENVKTLVDVSRASTHFRLTAASAPLRLLLDPEIRLPRAMAPLEMPRAPIPEKALVIYTESGKARAEKLDNGDRTLKLAATVKDAELKDDLVLIGGPEANPVWAKLAASAPFIVHGNEVTYRGRTYADAAASASTPNPLSPGHTITWLTDRAPNVPRSGFGDVANPTRVAVYSPNGDLLDAELALPSAGPTVFDFKR